MNTRSFWLIPLTLCGVALLGGSLWFFHYPLFGKVIFGIILAVFLSTAYRFLLWMKDCEAQMQWIKEHGEQSSLPAEGLPLEIQKRKKWIESLIARGEDPSRTDFADLLSVRESAKESSFSGGTLIVLGLLGTFYGLLNVVTEAGAATAAQHVDLAGVLPRIFANLQGIFGSSLSGLAASLLLTAMQGLWQNTQSEFMAEMEEYCRFILIPLLKPKELTKSEDPLIQEMRELRGDLRKGLREPIEEHLNLVLSEQNKWQENLSNRSNKLLQDLEEKLSHNWQNQGNALLAHHQESLRQIEQNLQQSWQSMEQSFSSHLSQHLSAGIQSSLEQSQNLFEQQWKGQSSLAQAQIDAQNKQLQLFETLKSDFHSLMQGLEKEQSSHWEALSQNQAQQSQNWMELQQQSLEKLSQEQQSLLSSSVEKLWSSQTQILDAQKQSQEMQFQSLQNWSQSLELQNQALLQSQSQSLEELKNKTLEVLELQAKQAKAEGQLLQESVHSLSQGIQEHLPKIAEIGGHTTERIENAVVEILNSQAQAQSELQKAQLQWSEQIQTMAASWDQLRSDGLDGLLETLKTAAQGSQIGLEALSSGLESFQSRLEQSLVLQERLALEWKSSLEELRIHQIDLQASMEFFRSGTEYMVENFAQKEEQGAQDAQKEQRWQEALLRQAEQSSEILRENAQRTREILMEAIQRIN